jgi:chaperonin cofactor prefoldin
MNANKHSEPSDAQAQVEAFLRVLQERIGIDEARMAQLAQKQLANGRHVTWVWVVGILIVAITALLTRTVTQLDRDIEQIARRIDTSESRMTDVRERLRVLEEKHRSDTSGGAK